MISFLFRSIIWTSQVNPQRIIWILDVDDVDDHDDDVSDDDDDDNKQDDDEHGNYISSWTNKNSYLFQHWPITLCQCGVF